MARVDDPTRAGIVPWLMRHGINPDEVYRYEIVSEVANITTITVYRYARNAFGHRYRGDDGEPATEEPLVFPLECWPENV